MNILVTGGTGFLGRWIVRRLVADGHAVTVVSRNPVSRGVEGCSYVTWGGLPVAEISLSADTVVHLAGDAVFPGRWTSEKKIELLNSRVQTLRGVLEVLRRRGAPLRTVISASAIGFYGNAGSSLVDENAPRGPGFLADLVESWERCALVESRNIFSDVRAVSLRFGIILHPSGGVLKRLWPLFSCGLGGKLGAGLQYMSWIHLDDAVESVLFVLNNSVASGVWNVVSPCAATNAEFTKVLADTLRRPAFFAVPAWVLRTIFGEGACVVLEGQNVVPTKLLDAGFRFRYSKLADALRRQGVL
jgi:uncharacterized protein (TIGR01777 family)